eukprot:CAMPEP_0185187430 /NCGR_PEP_ID=MMETSP1140-20130426/4733_1 /TAXON_ID=298111 /ORGANISM="Pavlova sp., Strain CCMP459" /LENGTH=159 /DNA_ID=CAMNT_0027753825 /DNA_START=574 /DNA_END=1053 /DNA_ORIENTATION=-
MSISTTSAGVSGPLLQAAAGALWVRAESDKAGGQVLHTWAMSCGTNNSPAPMRSCSALNQSHRCFRDEAQVESLAKAASCVAAGAETRGAARTAKGSLDACSCGAALRMACVSAMRCSSRLRANAAMGLTGPGASGGAALCWARTSAVRVTHAPDITQG